MNRRRRKYTLGLVGDSTVEQYPMEYLEDQDIDPIMLSCSPKKARNLVYSGRLNYILHNTLEQHPDLDGVFIFIGGNDVKQNSEVRDIAENIVEIAEGFENIGIPPLIMPLVNRDNPSGILVPKYRKIKNSVNRLIRRYYQSNYKKYNVINIENLELKPDGIHLTRRSYRTISRAIKIQMNFLTTSN